MENLSVSNSVPAPGSVRSVSSAGAHRTHSPEPIEPVTDAEFPLVTRLTQGLEQCDWEKLQEKYSDAMAEHTRVEEDLRSQTAKLLETTVLQDENRALKRFKTQMQHVQNSEMSVENKKKHYEEVVKAFQSALALLNAQMRA